MQGPTNPNLIEGVVYLSLAASLPWHTFVFVIQFAVRAHDPLDILSIYEAKSNRI
jgi:hypothetical protein